MCTVWSGKCFPTPFSAASVPLPPETGGRWHTSLRVGVGGESQFRRGAYTMVLFICTYFVRSTFLNLIKIVPSRSQSHESQKPLI
jgi:hypothetical protein